MARKPEAEHQLRSWIRYAIYPVLALLLALLPLLAQVASPSGPGSPFHVVGIYLLAGPLFAAGMIVLAAYRYRDQHGAGDGYLGGFAGLTVALVGAACIVAATTLVTVASERLSSWVVALVLEFAGVLAFGAAMVIAARGRRHLAPDADTATVPTSSPDDDPVLGRLEREVSQSADQWRRSSRRWGIANYVLGFSTAALSGAAGVSGVTGDPTLTESVFAILAIVGAGLAALTTSLGAAEAHKQSRMKAVALESLARQIRWRPVVGSGPPLEVYIDRFNEVTGPNWPSSGDEPPAGSTPPTIAH